MYGLKHQIILDCWMVIENVFILWSFLVALQLLVIDVKLSRSFPTLKSARLWERYYRYSRAEFVIYPNSSNHHNVLSVVGQKTTGKYTALPSTRETTKKQYNDKLISAAHPVSERMFIIYQPKSELNWNASFVT